MTDRTGPFDELRTAIQRLTRRFEAMARLLEGDRSDHSDRRIGRHTWRRTPIPSLQSGLTSLDLVDEGDEFRVTVDAPGYEAADLEIRLTGPSLLITGNREQEAIHTDSSPEHARTERSVQSFSRQVPLPAPVETDAVTATVNNGILTVRLPKRESTHPDETTPIDIE
ncbi:Hsp20/alpha crystallin family protein [Natronolimnobius sp. AArcel1]|uniref:Hsp20/alpha crystallin family protein n=1 Tax=Natronolimnobius sp. AArcel1 TaxID=1679093 RepID=UPI0013EE10BA|nr:Hsp20/alpha crystallin family protein [Natronolimnobius sp. AArcel1]NGM67503.1 Hsp20/alpha crystallin family protein [Natronolimnobius sp. AArcel1]